MKRSFRLAAGLLALSSVQAAWGYNFVLQHSILSAFRNASNLDISETAYQVAFIRTQDEEPLYINQVEFVFGDNWDANIDLYDGGEYLRYNGGLDFYRLGDPITGDAVWLFDQVAWRRGGLHGDVAPGIYDFNIVFRGGADASATDTLANLACKLAVAEKLDVVVTAFTSPGSIHAGQSADAYVSVTNRMEQDFVTTSWFYWAPGFKNGSAFLNGTFQGSWFNRSVAPGDTLTGIHSRWSATDATPLGAYTGNIGLVGGLYYGDWHFIQAFPYPQIEVTAVPEPLTALGLGAGLAGLIAARRRARR